MAEWLFDEQAGAASVGAGQMAVFPDSGSGTWSQRDKANRYQGDASRAAIVAQGPGFATDTYLTNSGLILPSWSMQAGVVFEWKIVASKTAAGVATPIYQIRIGTNQTTADTSRLSMTGPAQTAVVDEGILTILATCRNVAVAGVLQAVASWQHEAAVAAGFGETVQATSSAFDNTALGGQYVGLSINGGSAAAWTVTQVFGRVYY